MNRRNLLLVTAVVIGLSLGVAASTSTKQEGKCEKTEESIRQEANLSGAVACFPPGVMDVNLSERVEEGSQLECVCRRSYRGNVQIWAINSANP
jgi:hypothetical protein